MRKPAKKKKTKPASKKPITGRPRPKTPAKAAPKTFLSRAGTLKENIRRWLNELHLPSDSANRANQTPADTRLPAQYHEDRLVLLPRDPWWLFAYWEITPERQESVRRRMAGEGIEAGIQTVLRIYDSTGSSPGNPHSHFDIELPFFTDNWYIDVGLPDHVWTAEIGLRAPDGRFFALVRSNSVRTPSFGLSDSVDEEWMLPDDVYRRILGLSVGSGLSGSSSDIAKMLDRYLKSIASSESQPHVSKKASLGG